MNPYTLEGKKTVSFEIAEQLRWQVPDVVVVSVGDGNIISGVHKGFRDLLELGWIDRIPRLIGVQASGSAAATRSEERRRSGQNGTDQFSDRGRQHRRPISRMTVSKQCGRCARLGVRCVGARSSDPGGLYPSWPFERRICRTAAAAVYAGIRTALVEEHVRLDERVLLLVTAMV